MEQSAPPIISAFYPCSLHMAPHTRRGGATKREWGNDDDHVVRLPDIVKPALLPSSSGSKPQNRLSDRYNNHPPETPLVSSS
jgi:hypothetical protein